MYLYEYVYIYISYSIRDRIIPRFHRIVLSSCYTYTLPPSHGHRHGCRGTVTEPMSNSRVHRLGGCEPMN